MCGPPSGRRCRLLGLKQFLHSPGFHTCSVNVLQADMSAVLTAAHSVHRKALHHRHSWYTTAAHSSYRLGAGKQLPLTTLTSPPEKEIFNSKTLFITEIAETVLSWCDILQRYLIVYSMNKSTPILRPALAVRFQQGVQCAYFNRTTLKTMSHHETTERCTFCVCSVSLTKTLHIYSGNVDLKVT